ARPQARRSPAVRSDGTGTGRSGRRCDHEPGRDAPVAARPHPRPAHPSWSPHARPPGAHLSRLVRHRHQGHRYRAAGPGHSVKTALIAGATDGVGRVVAGRLAADGWRVLVHGRSEERGQSLVRAIEGTGGTATFLKADLASLAEVRRLAGLVN